MGNAVDQLLLTGNQRINVIGHLVKGHPKPVKAGEKAPAATVSMGTTDSSTDKHRVHKNIDAFDRNACCLADLVADLVHNASRKNLYVDTVINNNMQGN